MIPLRIYLKGFMSYLGAAELRFDGAALWLLSGRNGAGKSAIFEAMTFALYGTHNRGDTRLVKELIHKRADGLVVEFDFSVAGARYRIKRTTAQRKPPTFQAFRLQDTSDGTVRPIAIDETDSEDGLNRWVIAIIGLQARAFTTSILLQQGKADALLEAEPRDRHAILSQIVDLSAYERLCARAEEQAKSLEIKTDLLRAQRDALQPVDPSMLTVLAGQITEFQAAEQAAQASLVALLVCKEQAKRWYLLEEERQTIEAALERMYQLCQQEDQIRSEAARYEDLQRVLPTLHSVHRERLSLALTEQKIEQCMANKMVQADQIRQAQVEYATVQEEQKVADARLTTAQQEQARAQATLMALQPDILALEQMTEIEAELTCATEAIEALPLDLPSQINEVQATITHLQEARNSLPWLRQYASARHAWQIAGETEHSAILEVETLCHVAERAKSDCALAEEGAERARDLTVRLTAAQTRHATLFGEVQSQLERFQQIDALPMCIYCGQALSSHHLATERTRLETELEQAQLAAEEAAHEADSALSAQKECEQALIELRGHAQETERHLHIKQTCVAEAQRDRQRALDMARTALQALPAHYHHAVVPCEELEQVIGDSDAFPTTTQLATLEAETLRLDEISQVLLTLREQQEERVKRDAAQRSASGRLARMVAQYPATRVAALCTAQAEATAQHAAADAEIARLHPVVDAAFLACRARAETLSDLNERLAKTVIDLTNARTTYEGIMRTIEALTETLPIPWRAVAATLTAEVLTGRQREFDAISEAPAQLATLDALLREQQQRQDRLATITREAQGIPVESRRAVTVIDADVDGMRVQHEDAAKKRSLAEREHGDLLAQQESRAQLDTEARDTGLQASLHRTLTTLLGRDRLQHHLLRQAESAIIVNANAVLDRISSGTLRLNLRDHTSTTTTPKALDLVAYNIATGNAPLRVAFLSGSQRFRVAVSLALGIGQYASAGSHRVESVIIDEGFGSLDKEGRYEMIDELHTLRDMLRCVILVSHQEEFATAFTNSYSVQIEDGSSTVRLLAG